MKPCKEWTRATAHGYGVIWHDGKLWLVHRLEFLRHHGYLPKVVRHSCDNPRCYEITHLLGGTMQDNSQDMMRRGRGRGQYKLKLSAEDIEEIVTRYVAGERPADIAQDYGIHYVTVRNYVKKHHPELLRSRRGGTGRHLYAR